MDCWIISQGEYDDERDLAVVTGTEDEVRAAVESLNAARIARNEAEDATSTDNDPFGYRPLPVFLGDVNMRRAVAGFAEIASGGTPS